MKEGLNEPLRLAVGLRAVGAGDLVTGAEGIHGRWEGSRGGVGESSIGEDALDLHTLVGEERRGGQQEASCRLSSLVGEGLDVGDSGGIVHRYVDVVIARSSWPSLSPFLPAENMVAASRGDAPQLLRIEVQGLPGVLTHIADRDPRGAV